MRSRLKVNHRVDCKKNITLIVALCALVAVPLSAQELSDPSESSEGTRVNRDEAIPVGPFIFSPALQLSWQHRDNIFFTPDDEVADQVYLVKARLLFEVPIYESYVSFSYVPQYRDYKDYDFEDKWQHFVDVSTALEFSSGLTLTATYNYVKGNLETREVDPGGELVFGDRNFVKNFVGVGGDYWITGRDGILFDLSWTDLNHEDPQLFYDYTRLTGGLGWIHQLSPILVMDVKYGVEDFTAEDSPYQSNSFRDSTSHALSVGLRGQINPVVATELRVGYGIVNYNIQPGDPPVEDFKGVIVNGFMSWDMAHGSVLRLDLLRAPYPSNFADNANYLAAGGSLMYSIDRGKIFGQARGRFQNNDYQLPDPVTGEKRSDDILSFGLGLGFRFTNYLSLWGTYLYEDRDTIYRYSYTINTFTLGLVVGF